MPPENTPLSLDGAAQALREPEQAPETNEAPAAEAPEEAAPEEVEETETEAPAADEGEQAPEEEVAEADEPAEPAIDPPVSWTKADKALFATLPPEAQRVIAQRERARDAEVGRNQQELAAERKAIVEREAQYEKERTHLEDLLLAKLPQEPDPALIDTNPQEYLRQKALFERGIGEIQAIVAAREAEAAKEQAETSKAEAAHREEQAKLLVEMIPELTGPEGAKIANAMTAYGKAQGYDEATLAIANASDLAILHKAMKWDNAQRAAKAAKAKLVPKVAAPGVGRSKAEQTADQRKSVLARLERTGSIEDAVAALRQ